MKVLNGTVSRRDAVLVAAALLLPIPVLAQSGLSVPLPGAVERSLGSLVTLDASDDRTGTSANGGADTAAAEDGTPSSYGTVAVRNQRSKRRILNGRPSAATPVDMVSDQPVGDGTFGGGPPAGDDPGAAGGGSGTGAPGDPSSGSGGSTGSDAPSQSAPPPSSSGETTAPPPPGLSVSAGGPGSGAGASVGEDGLAIDLGGNTDGAGDGGDASVEVTDQNGSSRGLEIPLGVPGGLLGP